MKSKKKKWHVKFGETWYPLKDIKDSGKPAEEEGGGNLYHLEGVDKPVHQSEIKDMREEGEENMDKSEKIPGGRASGKKPSSFDAEQLKIGTKHEMEHTDDKSTAREIAMDHLAEDANYYKKLNRIEKYDRVEVAADGKKELTYGSEDLSKLKDKWKKLKKALDSNTAFLDLQQAQGGDQDEDQGVEQEKQQAPEENQVEPEAQEEQPDEAAQADDSQQVPEEQSIQELTEALKNDGYSDQEIAYILHDHAPPQPTADDYGTLNEKESGAQDREHNQAEHEADIEHQSRMNDVEYTKAQSEVADPNIIKDHQKRMLDTEYAAASGEAEATKIDLAHKQRMLDLDFEAAKKERDLEVKFKEKELALKLEVTKERNQQRQIDVRRDAQMSRKMDAKTTSAKERSGDE